MIKNIGKSDKRWRTSVWSAWREAPLAKRSLGKKQHTPLYGTNAIGPSLTLTVGQRDATTLKECPVSISCLTMRQPIKTNRIQLGDHRVTFFSFFVMYYEFPFHIISISKQFDLSSYNRSKLPWPYFWIIQWPIRQSRFGSIHQKYFVVNVCWGIEGTIWRSPKPPICFGRHILDHVINIHVFFFFSQ